MKRRTRGRLSHVVAALLAVGCSEGGAPESHAPHDDAALGGRAGAPMAGGAEHTPSAGASTTGAGGASAVADTAGNHAVDAAGAGHGAGAGASPGGAFGAAGSPSTGGMSGAAVAGGAGLGGGVSGGGRGGSAESGGNGGSGGAEQGGRAGSGGGGGMGGGAGAAGAASGPFSCSQVTGGQLVEEWFIAGFEQVVDDARWQVKWRVDGYLEAWADPQSSFWSAQVDSTCANTAAPDRIVFPIVSWVSRSRADWASTIKKAIGTFQAKYPGIRRMDLMTQIRGPNNMLCPSAPTQGETIVVPPELDGAIDDVAAAFPGFVFVGPRVEARSCSDIQGGGPHLTSAGNTAAAVPLSDYFVKAQ